MSYLYGAPNALYEGVGIPTANLRLHQPKSYEVLVAPATTPISLDFMKSYLKIDPSVTTDDDLITTLINAATLFFEDYTNYILINTGFRTYADFFFMQYELRRAVFNTLDAFEYSVDGTFQAVPNTNYYTTQETQYSLLIFNDWTSMPQDKDDKRQTVRIDFTAGYGDTQNDIPADIQIGLAQIVTYFYENRGDCECLCGGNGGDIFSKLPPSVQLIISKYRGATVTGQPYRGQ